MAGVAKILLVEDDLALRDGIADLLEVSDLGFDLEILKASNGLIGLQMVSENPPDLIISDIMMPRMGGYEFLERLRSEPDWLNIPIIFLTALGTPADILKGRLSGAELYLTKPYDSDELITMVQSQLHRSYALRDDRRRRLDLLSRDIVYLLNHEFRTPLTYVTAYYQLLVNGLAQDDVDSLQEYLRGIQTGATRLRYLVGNLIQVMALRTGEAALSIKQGTAIISDLPEIMRQVVARYERVTRGRPIQFEVSTSADLPPVFAHRESLLVILNCLVDNAVKFSQYQDIREPSVALLAELYNGWVKIVVKDNGIGLPENAHQQVFELFYQHDRKVLEQQGAGLGLAIVKGLVDLHGGCVKLGGQEGEGFSVEVILPAYDQNQPADLGQADRKIPATILIVEDEIFLLEGLADLLVLFDSDYEMTILTARDGYEALQTMDHQLPDLIISDIMMPYMDGYEFLDRVRSNPSWVNIPFIFLTAKGDHRDIVHGRSKGVEEYITKPYDGNELFNFVLAQLDRHHQRQSVIRENFEKLKQNVLDLVMADLSLPLDIVSQYTELLANDLGSAHSDQELKTHLEAIERGSKQVSQFVEDFILLVELRTGEAVDWYVLQQQPGNINQVIRSICRTWSITAGHQDVHFELDLAEVLEPVLIPMDLLASTLERLIEMIAERLDASSPQVIYIRSDQKGSQVQLEISTAMGDWSAAEVEMISTLLDRREPIVPELYTFEPALLLTKSVFNYHDGLVTIRIGQNDKIIIGLQLPAYQPAGEEIRIGQEA